MGRRRNAIFLLASAFLSPNDAGAWGKAAHRAINEGAILLLPEPLKEAYLKHQSVILDESVAPDEWKRSDRAEGPRHYIDIDLYEKYPFASFPLTQSEARARFGDNIVKESGTLPWRIEEYFEKLVKAFKERNAEDAALLSGQLGHYVGDLYQPLHTTADHNGQLSGSRGIHLMFEDKMIDLYMDDFRLDSPAPIQPADNVLTFIFGVIREGYPDAQKILGADQAARKKARFGSRIYLQTLFELSGSVAGRRMGHASAGLASLWHAAWIKAGKPKL